MTSVSGVLNRTVISTASIRERERGPTEVNCHSHWLLSFCNETFCYNFFSWKICIFLSRSSNTHFIFDRKEVWMFVVKSGNHVSTPLPLASWSGEVWELRQRTQISTHSQHLNWNNSISAEETEQFGFITCFLSYDPAEDNGSGCISWSFELGPLIESGDGHKPAQINTTQINQWCCIL